MSNEIKLETPNEAYLDNGGMKEIIQWLQSVVTEEHIFIDIGAHIGAIFVPVVKETRPKNAFAFEPTPETFEFLEKNCKTNLDTPYLLHNNAISNVTKDDLMYDCSWGSPSNTLIDRFEGKLKPTIPVKLIRLDEMFNEKTIGENKFILKIDAELSEPEVWEGMRSMFPSIDGIIMEIFSEAFENAGKDISKFLDQIRADDFQIYDIYGEHLVSNSRIIKMRKTDIVLKPL